jgi:hypothetical protein
MLYRFLGATSEIGRTTKLDQLGQKLQLSEAEALNAMQGGCVLLPDAEYQKLGFTAEEEKKHRYAGARRGASVEFKAKLKRGLEKYDQILAEEAMGILVDPSPQSTSYPEIRDEVKEN